MGSPIIGAMTPKARVRLRTVALIGLGLFSVAGTILPASADNGALYVAPGPSNLVAPDVAKRSQEQLAGTARKLGDLIGDSLKSRTTHADRKSVV